MSALNQTNILKIIGQNIRFYRNRLEISQEELAFRCSINKNYLSDIERGTRNLTIFALLKISEGLKVNIKDLFTIETLD